MTHILTDDEYADLVRRARANEKSPGDPKTVTLSIRTLAVMSTPPSVFGKVKVTDAQVAEIRAEQGRRPSRAVGASYGLSHRQVLNIWNGASRSPTTHESATP
jgi:hypothetical protein